MVIMRVKVAELKSRLSHYLREVGERGQDIEICVRETPVAHLVGLRKDAPPDEAEQAEVMRLRAALAGAGLAWESDSVVPGPLPPVHPIRVGSGHRPAETVRKIRQEKDW